MIEGAKPCPRCKESRPLSEFSLSRSRKDGLACYCKDCEREKARLWRERSPEKYREGIQRWREENPEKVREAARGRERRRDQEQRRIYRRNRRKADPAFRAADLFRRRFRKWFDARGAKKDSCVLDVVGCTTEELIAHLEAQFQPGMTWDNWSVDGWHVDHKIPLASAGDDVEAMLRLWHYTNLQPLWAEENWRKGAKAA